MSTHEQSTSLVFVFDTTTQERLEIGAEVHAPTWSGNLTGLAQGCWVRVMDRQGRTDTYHPDLFNLTVSAMADCGCSVTDGMVNRAPWCEV